MECPSCGLDVLVHEGKITSHQRPSDLTPCDGKASGKSHAHASDDHDDKKPPAKKTSHTAEKKTDGE